MNSAVLWDLNGVIVDDMRFHLQSFQLCLRQLGYEMTEQYFVERCTGTPPTEVFEHILPLIGSPITIDEAVDRKRRIYFDLTKGRIAMLPGCLRLITDLRGAGFRQAVASGATRMEVESILAEFGIAGFFDAVVACEDVVHGKPDPEPFLRAATLIGVQPECCVVIEDGEYGVRAAKSCGMKAIAVTNTQTAEILEAADAVVETLEIVTPALVTWLLDMPSGLCDIGEGEAHAEPPGRT